MDSSLNIVIAARSSALSRAQVQEVYEEIRKFHPIQFQPIWVETKGDRDLATSLRALDKTDFFTKEIDVLQMARACRISIHSAKDLPHPLAPGLCIAAITRGVDNADALVLREKENLTDLPVGARIGTSSLRRESAILALRADLVCVDIRGPIERRLALLDACAVDGVIVAEAALIRLQLTERNRMRLHAEAAPGQGQLAVIVRQKDEEMKRLFACIDSR